MKKKMLNIRFWAYEWDAVNTLSEVQDRTKTEIVRTAVRQYLRQEGMNLPTESEDGRAALRTPTQAAAEEETTGEGKKEGRNEP